MECFPANLLNWNDAVYADIFERVAMGQTPTQGEIHDMIAMVDEDNSGEIGAFHLAAALGRITNGDLS